ncbi:MAG: outer membrane lipoprotein chaperone LolA [Pseudomonadales bacterium]|nr:outer membrane lipoprotein chaperone LolA [Pseudomonadales bacterium]
MKFSTLLAGLCLLTSVWVHADDQAVQQLNQLLMHIDDAKAHFTQHIIDTRGVRGRDFSGTMQVKRPGYFRWDTQQPYAQTIVADGHKVWVYDPDLNQVLIEAMDKQVGNTPALLLSSDTQRLAKNFEVTSEPVPAGEASFLLKPKSSDAMFEAMRVKFAQGVITEMQLKDSMGQKTRIQFSDVHYHQKLDLHVFQFKIPQGADVVQQ